MTCVWRPVLSGVLLLAVLGCSGERRNALSGRVSYKGEPIPYGRIVFEPDTAKGQKGVQGVAEIHDGTYQTSPAAGTLAGPYQAHITGYAGPPDHKRKPPGPGPALFKEYIIAVELPDGAAEINFDVPDRK